MKAKKLATVALTISLLLGGASLSSASVEAAAKNVKIQPVSVQMSFDGVQIQPPAGQFIFNYKGTTYVPLRFVSYALQKNVEWDSKKLQVNITDPTANQLVAIKERMMNLGQDAAGAQVSKAPLNISPIDAKYVFNGETKTVTKGQISFIYKGTIYVPMRFVAESTGAVIKWDSKTKAISGFSPAYLKEQGTDKGDSGATNPGTTPGDGKDNAGQTPGKGGAEGTGTDTAYDSITKATQSKLVSLQNKSESLMWDLANKYLAADDDATKKKLLSQGQDQLDKLSAEFDAIVADAEKQLKDGGYSTDIIKEYRAEFEKQIEAGKKLAERMN